MIGPDTFADRVGDVRSMASLLATVAVVVGFAQMARSDVEQVIGSMYMVSGGWLMLGRMSTRVRTLSFGFAAVAVSFAARSASAWFIPNATWHGSVIVATTWGSLALIASAWTVRVARDSQ